jgi:large-conductance mechanosensitive channel
VMALEGVAVGSLVTTMVGDIVGEPEGVAEGCCDVEEVGDTLGNEKVVVAFDPLINAPKLVVVVVVVCEEVG